MGISVKKSTKNEKKFPKMESIAFKLIFVAFAVFTVSAVNKGEDDIMKILAKEREETREERKQLTAERQEMREMFRRETARLDEEDKRQRDENQKLREQNDKLEQQDRNLKEQNDKQQAQIAKLDKEDKRMKEQNDKQQDQIAKLRRENQKLRRADAKIKQSIRQKDQNNSLEVTMVKKFIRQDDVHSELQKIIRNEMQTFLKEERLCVGGRRSGGWMTEGKQYRDTVEFGYTFPRVPTVIASLVGVRSYGTGGASLRAESVSNSSAVIYIDTQWGNAKMWSTYTWLACLKKKIHLLVRKNSTLRKINSKNVCKKRAK